MEASQGNVRGVVATDNFLAGVQAGQVLAAALGGQGKVALLRLQTGVPSTNERERGFRLGAEEGGLSILIDTYIGDDSQAAAHTASTTVRPPSAQIETLAPGDRLPPQRDLAARLLGSAERFDHSGRAATSRHRRVHIPDRPRSFQAACLNP